MDMQGDPVEGNSSATKHTSDPERFQNPIEEGAGPVASDSLAADSARSGGKFGENRDSNPLSVPGSKSTFANTDTSGASTLPAASDARSRDNQGDKTGPGERYPEGADGSYSDSSKGDSYGNSGAGAGGAFSDHGAGGPSADKISSSGYSNTATGSERGSRGDERGSYGGVGGGSDDSSAPGYVSSVTQPFGEAKPKGKNITEGSDEDFKGPSTQGADIGSDDDPGRVAENAFQRSAQGASGATGPKQGAQSGEHPYSGLGGDQEL